MSDRTANLITQGTLKPLNRAVAVAEWQGAAAGLAVLEKASPPSWLAGSYLWAAVLADFQRRKGDAEAAERYRDVAIQSDPSPAVQALLRRRLEKEDSLLSGQLADRFFHGDVGAGLDHHHERAARRFGLHHGH